MRLVADSSASHFMWLADDDVLDPSLVAVVSDFLDLHPALHYLGWGFCTHNYVTGLTERPSLLPAVSFDLSHYANVLAYLDQPISCYIYGLYRRDILLGSALGRWCRQNVFFDWMDVAFIMSNLLNYRSHFLPDQLVIYGIDEAVRPRKGAAGLVVKRYDPFPWLKHGIMLILFASRLSVLERIKLLPKFVYAWRNTSTFAINHS